jgi:ssDNA-binding Zn-finger/Zn-ribbon topoisomerase 1
MTNDMQVDLSAKFKEVDKSKRCFACNKQLVKSQNDKGHIHFCGNKNCGNAGFGYIELANGLAITGNFTDALNELRKMQF